MTKITTVGLDLAKQVFHVVCCDERGKVIGRKMLRRSQVLEYFANLSSLRVGMESCASAHYWARKLQGMGHEVKLLPPQFVKAFVRGNKNDYNDALAIAEAVGSGWAFWSDVSDSRNLKSPALADGVFTLPIRGKKLSSVAVTVGIRSTPGNHWHHGRYDGW